MTGKEVSFLSELDILVCIYIMWLLVLASKRDLSSSGCLKISVGMGLFTPDHTGGANTLF